MMVKAWPGASRAQDSADADRAPFSTNDHSVGSERIMVSTSSVFACNSSRSSASRFKRSRGCVFEGRKLNHHAGKVTVMPSR